MNKIPVVDLFAGPGGLGEGFSAYTDQDDRPVFNIILSVEKEKDAHRTLTLRSFFRKFPHGKVPDEYYDYLRGEISRDVLFEKYPDEATLAINEAWCEILGNDKELNDRIDNKIRNHLNTKKDSWILIGGPPCQAYSVVGRSRNKGIKKYVPEDDPRSYLYKEYLRIISCHRPTIFVMENVKGMLSAKLNGKSVFEQIISDLTCPSKHLLRSTENNNESDIEYDIYPLVCLNEKNNSIENDPDTFIVKSEEYGIPQARHRVILFGVRREFTHHKPDSLKKSHEVTVCDVLDGLPKARSGLSKNKDGVKQWKAEVLKVHDSQWFINMNDHTDLQDTLETALAEIESRRDLDRGKEFTSGEITVRSDLASWYLDERLGGVCNHTTRGHMASDLHRYLYASCFAELYKKTPKVYDLPEELIPNHKNVRSGHFDDRFRVQLADRPSMTITSHISKDGHYYIHYDPTQCRSLTVREAARLQTFPDNYFFEGGRTSQYIQVGNAVPPLLARQIAAIVYDLIQRTQKACPPHKRTF
jgi:DNA (cytosine-5)-methyltransferase 1